MKIFRDAQKGLAKAILRYKLERKGIPAPPESELDRQSERLLDEANRVLKEGGRRIFEEVKGTCRDALGKHGPGAKPK